MQLSKTQFLWTGEIMKAFRRRRKLVWRDVETGEIVAPGDFKPRVTDPPRRLKQTYVWVLQEVDNAG